MFQWTNAAQEAFETLKVAMTSTLVLALSDFSKTFLTETDACREGTRVVLMHEGHLIAYPNKVLSPKNKLFSIYKKEILVILLAIKI